MLQLLIPVGFKDLVINRADEFVPSGKGQSLEPELLFEDRQGPVR